MYFLTKAVLLGTEQACPFKFLFFEIPVSSYQSVSIGADSSYITDMVKKLLHNFAHYSVFPMVL